MYIKRSLDEKFDLIMKCRNSGLSDFTWCKQNGIPSSTFYYWIKQLKNSGANLPEPKVPVINEKQDVVKLEIVDEVPIASKPVSVYQDSAPIEIEIGKVSIKISNDVDPALFSNLISYIGERL